MALPATHIRFAASIAAEHVIGDMGDYLSGTLYPDSRWLTGVDRKQTHARRFLDPAFPTDAFTLGWHVHCVCDRIQSKLHEQLLDGLPDLTAEERWILFSAAKVVQDMYDAELIDLNSRMPMLTRAAAPNNESKDLVFEYLRRVCRVYLGGKASTWDRYARLWQAVNLEQSRIDAIEKQVGDILGDGLLAQRIRDTFDQMVRLWQTDWGFPQPESGSGDG